MVKKAAKPVLKPGPGGGGRDPTPPANRVTFGPNEPDVPPPSPLGALDFGHLRAPSPGKDMRLKTPSASPGRAANSEGKGKGKKGGKAGGKGGKKGDKGRGKGGVKGKGAKNAQGGKPFRVVFNKARKDGGANKTST